TGEILPSLAESWTVSPDGRSYTFRLRKDVRFHDGTTFEASDVIANLDYIVDPDHHSQKAVFLLGPYQSAEAPDDRTLILHLSQPFPPLLDSLSQVYLGIASPEALARWGPSEYPFHQVGTGPYRFVEYVPNDHLTLAKNPDYNWAPAIYHNARPYFDEIVFRFYEDPATRALALENGDVDVMGEVPPLDARRLGDSGTFTLQAIPISGQPTQFLFNTARPPTNDPEVRRALIQAVDRQAVVSTIYGESSPVADGPLSHNNWAFSQASPFPSYDTAAASDRLEAAGWAVGPSGVRQHDGQPLQLKIVAPSWGYHPEVAQLLEAAWEAIGAQVEVQVAPGFGLLKEAVQSGDYNLVGSEFFGTDPDVLRPMFASGGLYNWMNVADPALDDLLERAATTAVSQNERRTLYAEAAQRIQDQSLILPVRDYVDLVVANARLTGLRFNYQGWFPLLLDLRPSS
ncbi:MAG TPA: ABC transporter substrate-binding protein, partial [Anaerolineales bacterium]|nr:ABC transporter substrate-binding protein [Anaerolineales bacterium]